MDFPYTPTLDKGAQTSALTLTIYRLWPTHTLSGVRGKPWISPTPTVDKGAQTSALTLTIYRLWPTHTLSGVRGKPWISPILLP